MSRHINLGDTTTSDRNGGLGWGKVVNFALWQMGWLLLDGRDMSSVCPPACGLGNGWAHGGRSLAGCLGGLDPAPSVRLLTKSRPKIVRVSSTWRTCFKQRRSPPTTQVAPHAARSIERCRDMYLTGCGYNLLPGHLATKNTTRRLHSRRVHLVTRASLESVRAMPRDNPLYVMLIIYLHRVRVRACPPSRGQALGSGVSHLIPALPSTIRMREQARGERSERHLRNMRLQRTSRKGKGNP